MLLSIREWYMDRKKLINQSIDYIMKHLDENLSLDTVAAHFFISKYHFSRIFKEETGESVNTHPQYVSSLFLRADCPF